MFLKDTQLFHDYHFVCYKTAAPQFATRNLLTIAALNIIMGNVENARFAFELVDESLLNPKSMPVYEAIKEYLENTGCRTSETYSMESLMPAVYKRLKRAKLFYLIFIIGEILAIVTFVFGSFIYLIIITWAY